MSSSELYNYLQPPFGYYYDCYYQRNYSRRHSNFLLEYAISEFFPLTDLSTRMWRFSSQHEYTLLDWARTGSVSCYRDRLSPKQACHRESLVRNSAKHNYVKNILVKNLWILNRNSAPSNLGPVESPNNSEAQADGIVIPPTPEIGHTGIK